MIKKVHLYVEKYDRVRQELLLDFVREDEFLFFRNRGDYISGMHLSKHQYEPTMLLVYGCSPKRRLWQGAILTMDMNRLMNLQIMQIEQGFRFGNSYLDHPATVFMEIFDGTSFANLIDEPENCSVSARIPKDYYVHLTSSWEGAPCALSNLKEEFNIHVWDVGQGSTNCISDKTNLTIFDFGSSFYYSENKQKAIIDAHRPFIEEHDRISLIISHWDVDHYNLLCVASDEFLNRLCCVYYPDQGVGLTMMQVAERIERNCNYRCAISATTGASHKCSAKLVFRGDRFALFVGDQCKSKNLSGLLLRLFNNEAAVLLTADHSNYQVWTQLYNAKASECNNILHIVVPHHGGDCGDTPIPKGINPGIAAISVGSNMFGHPKVKTITSYRNAGFKVMRTDRQGKDVVIELKE